MYPLSILADVILTEGIPEEGTLTEEIPADVIPEEETPADTIPDISCGNVSEMMMEVSDGMKK